MSNKTDCKNYILATSRAWHESLLESLNKKNIGRFHLINQPKELSLDKVKEVNPEAIFFPHWSTRIPSDIFDNFECIIFHMTDLPYGRGGSPLQNLIARGVYKTKISAIKCVDEIDAGPIYLKTDLDLEQGSAYQIYEHASKIIGSMIEKIIVEKITPQPQEGEPVYFKRRTEKDGDISKLTELREIYDYIRMLDCPGYPPAYIETQDMKMLFSSPELQSDSVKAKVEIVRKNV